MAQPFDIVGYQFNADQYCPRHIIAQVCARMGIEGHGLSADPEQALDRLARSSGIDRGDESSFDSGDFPKVIFRDQVIEQDDPDGEDFADRCGHCGELLADM